LYGDAYEYAKKMKALSKSLIAEYAPIFLELETEITRLENEEKKEKNGDLESRNGCCQVNLIVGSFKIT
jgi:hypothetical protein